MNHPTFSRLHCGFALITSLILLLVLTLVGLIAIRGTGLELRMSANDAMRSEALDRSESARAIFTPVIDVHVFNRGWPVLIGGDVPNSLFDFDIPSGLQIVKDGSPARPRDWYLGNSERITNASYIFSPSTLDTDADFDREITGLTSEPLTLAGGLAIYKVRTAINAGAGAAMVAGYEGTGKAAAASGANIFFFVDSEGEAPGDEARAETGAVFRNVIRN
ncbi:MAG: PilX N-terminal domain-containing pilus assembly protein [Sinimarinibacterium flocculans]|uniref:PilX N-terminal domain-containing pilus assembly protein n=1 Tax=Sinimarinibacterium flocculans TaxID=985250 RepID=UPI003C46A027